MVDTERTAEQKLKDRYKYQNEYIKNRYYKIAVALPKNYKDIVDNAIKQKGFKNPTEYIKALIDNDIKQDQAEKDFLKLVDDLNDPEKLPF